MQKNTLIIQVKVGNTTGYAYNNPIGDICEGVLMPTVQRYCQKYNYGYLLIDEYPKDRDITFFNKSTKSINHDYSQTGKNKCSTLIRYLNMSRDYDQIVSLDNDIWIPEHAEKLPEIKGHMAAEDKGKSWATFRNAFELPYGKFVNGGVQMVNRHAGNSLYSYISDVVDKKSNPPLDYHSDQSYMNYWRHKNTEMSYVLDSKWNFMVSCEKRKSDYTGVNFVHYAGVSARSLLHEDLKRGVIK